MRFPLFSEDDLLPLSALQHLLFCERQCALIHIEQAWMENLYTAEGRIIHNRVDIVGSSARGDVKTATGLALHSLRLGLVGKADVVEFHRHLGGSCDLDTSAQPFPVEYKRGRPKNQDWDKVQLCAQAICLEEMLGVSVKTGAIFYGKTRRRVSVVFDADLRAKTEETAIRLHTLIQQQRTPPPIYSVSCESCSFVESCLPQTIGNGKSVHQYLKEVIAKQ
jgi:CRISPR-associated exonuclease Cas4